MLIFCLALPGQARGIVDDDSKDEESAETR